MGNFVYFLSLGSHTHTHTRKEAESTSVSPTDFKLHRSSRFFKDFDKKKGNVCRHHHDGSVDWCVRCFRTDLIEHLRFFRLLPSFKSFFYPDPTLDCYFNAKMANSR